MLIKKPVARERNFALREKQRDSGEVVVMVTVCTKTSRNQKLCLRESGLALRVQMSSPLCGKLMTSRMMCQEGDGQTVWL